MQYYTCLTCGFPYLEEKPYYEGVGSDNICPCCGFQFGLDDFDEIKSEDEMKAEWRDNWIVQGMKWWSKSRNAPANWNPKKQLLNIGVKI